MEWGFGKTHGTVKGWFAGKAGTALEGTGGVVGKGLKGTAKGVGSAIGAGTGTVSGIGSAMRKAPGKSLLAIGTLGALAAGAAYIFRGSRSDASKAAINNGVDDLPPLMTTQDLMAQQQQTMMGLAPTPGDHANREIARRGGVPQQGPVNPAMSAVDPASVQDLGR